MERSAVIALGENQGTPRIYLEGEWLLKAGFEPDAAYEVIYRDKAVAINLTPTGSRRVSGKRNRTVPVIDIQNAELGKALRNATKLQVSLRGQSITITPAYTAVLVIGRRLNFTEGSLFSGAGFLTQAAAELGFRPKFAVEIDPDYAAVFETNHPGAKMFNMSAEQVPYEDLRIYRPLGLFTAGIPCEPFSNSRHWKRGADQSTAEARRDRSLPPEAHENGDMTFFTLRAIEATNPHTVVIENVPAFLESASGCVLMSALRRFGYEVDSRIINPVEYGELTTRKRGIIIARTGAAVVWPEPRVSPRTLGAIFDPEPHEWFNRETKAWLYEHWDAQTAKGNGFASQQVTAASTCVGTITKRYFAQQGQHPVVKHPVLPGTHRWFTMGEVKRLHGVPESYKLPDSKTLAGELIGQGVVVSTMREIIRANTRTA